MILIVGSNQTPTSTYYKKLGVGKSTLFEGRLTNNEVYHTSIADCHDLETHLYKFNRVIWAESCVDEFVSEVAYFDTLYLLKFNKCENIDGVDPYNLLSPNKHVKNIQDSIVFLGCSHTYGIALPSESDKYAYIVSNHFNLHELNFSAPGKGNFNSFDIFNHLDFYENQIVVLQLTDIARMRMYEAEKFKTISEKQLYNMGRDYVNVFNDKHLMFMLFNRLDLIVKYARQANLRLVIFNLGGNTGGDASPENIKLLKGMEYYLSNYPEYIPNIKFNVLDKGSDGTHYGPKTQRMWANAIIEKINNYDSLRKRR